MKVKLVVAGSGLLAAAFLVGLCFAPLHTVAVMPITAACLWGVVQLCRERLVNESTASVLFGRTQIFVRIVNSPRDESRTREILQDVALAALDELRKS